QNVNLGLAIFALDDGRPEEAEAWLREALPVALQIGGWAMVFTYWRLAESLRLFEELNRPIDLADARLALGRSLRAFGDVAGARTELERARALFSRIDATTRRDAIDRELAELVEGPAPAGPSIEQR